MTPPTTSAVGCVQSVRLPSERDACAEFVRTMVERGVPMSIDDLIETYDQEPTELAAACDPKLRAMVAAT
ncbi:hypothetical protein AB0D97_32480 [Streptomyces roseus]|uniref:hypothetical protein n=1 Tax=Streptomyces roseus TaxID=66430 RepID=UPI0033EAF3D4